MTESASRKPLAWPAMRASAVFIAGILLAAAFPCDPAPIAVLLGAAVLLIVPFHKREVAGDILAAAVLLLTGMFVLDARNAVERPLAIQPEWTRETIRVEGVVSGDVRERKGSVYFTLNCRSLSSERAEYRVSGLLPCVLYNRAVFLSEGSRISLRGRLRPIHHPLESRSFPKAPGGIRFTERLAVYPGAGEIGILEPGGGFFGNIRERVRSLVARYDFGGRNDLLLALTIGDMRAITPETRDTFTRSGIAHLLAVSGMNLGVLAVVVHFLLGLPGLGRNARFYATGAILLIYAGVCGFQPPIARAFLMAVLLSAALILERRNNPENALFAALILILAADPAALGGASLQLSFAAVWMLLTFHSPVMRRIPKRLTGIPLAREVLGIGVATLLASLITAPIAAAHFGLLPLASLPVNLPAVPLASLITVTGMGVIGLIALGPFFAAPAQAAAHLIGYLVLGLAWLADHAARIPFASLETGGIPPFAVAAFTMWLFIFSRRRGRPVFRKFLLYIPLVLIAVWTWSPLARAAQSKKECLATFFDVGQGDAAMVRSGGLAFLVDTGPPWGESTALEAVVIPTLKNLGVNRLEGVFLSHLDADHAAGLAPLLGRIPVERIFCRESAADSLRSRYGVPVAALSAGDSVAFPGGSVLVMAPGASAAESLTENGRSLVFAFSAGESRIIFPGDIGPEDQRAALPWAERLSASVLKVPHHGAAGLDSEFLLETHPGVAIISCGRDNRYGHPAAETVSLLERCGCRILRTDRDGTVTVDLRTSAIATER